MQRKLALATALVALAALPSAAPSEPLAPKSTQMAARASGYLAPGEGPDSRRLLPPPPVAGSADEARDRAAAEAALTRRGDARWALASKDAQLRLPDIADGFACALGINFAGTPAPRLMALLQRALPDVASSTAAAKNAYRRPRPFMVNGQATCTPAQEPTLRTEGSYPSGHSAIGWGTALLLAELAPDRADAILARGRAFGQSRVICNVHWLSDVEEGRFIATATVARLHADARFRADMAAARDELARLRRTAGAPEHDCAAEAATLSNG